MEQESDPTLLYSIPEMLVLPFIEQVSINGSRYMHYSRIKKRIVIKGDILCKQYCNGHGEFSHSQVFCLDIYSKCFYNPYIEQLVNIQALHNWCEKSDKNSISLQLGFLLATGSFSVWNMRQTQAQK